MPLAERQLWRARTALREHAPFWKKENRAGLALATDFYALCSRDLVEMRYEITVL
jgi:hypothetical protein